MGRRWSVPFYRLSTMFIYITGNIFDKKKFIFELYFFQILLIVLRLVTTVISPFQSVTEGEANLKLIVDVIIGCYAFALMMHFGMVHEDMAELMRCLREGFSNYSSFEISLQREEELKRVQDRMRATEKIMIFNCAKVTCLFAIYPFLYAQTAIPLSQSPLYEIFRYFKILFNLLITVSACSFHNNWELVVVSAVSCLKGEMGILADSISDIDQRARNMFDDLCQDLDSICWSSYLRPNIPQSQRRLHQRILYDEKMKENCLFECLKESIRHHQALIRTTSTLNKVVGACALIYAQTVGITVAICLFLIAQADHIISSRVLLYSLILLPSLMSQGLVCFFGQDLLDESENMRYSLYTSNWQDKSKRYRSCLRIMMSCSHRPLCLKSVIHTVNKGHFVEFLKGGYSFLNFLLSMTKVDN